MIHISFKGYFGIYEVKGGFLENGKTLMGYLENQPKKKKSASFRVSLLVLIRIILSLLFSYVIFYEISNFFLNKMCDRYDIVKVFVASTL